MMYVVRLWDGEEERTEIMNDVQLDAAKHDWATVIDDIKTFNPAEIG